MQLDLSTLDRRITQTERLLTVSRECGFTDAVAAIERDIRRAIMPSVAIVAMLAEGDDLTAVAARYRRLKEMLR